MYRLLSMCPFWSDSILVFSGGKRGQGGRSGEGVSSPQHMSNLESKMAALLPALRVVQVPFVGCGGAGEAPWYKVLSEKATKERLWEVGGPWWSWGRCAHHLLLVASFKCYCNFP